MSTETLLYPFSSKTGEYLQPPMVAQICRFTKNPITLSFTSTLVPPATGANEIAVMLDSEGKVPEVPGNLPWTIKADFRGVTYWLADGSKTTITELGVNPPVGALFEEPPKTQSQLDAERVLVIKAELLDIDQRKIRALSDAILLGDSSRLESLEAEAESLRVELRNLTPAA